MIQSKTLEESKSISSDKQDEISLTERIEHEESERKEEIINVDTFIEETDNNNNV